MKYAVGDANGQIAFISGAGPTPLVNIIVLPGILVGAMVTEELTERVVRLLNLDARYDLHECDHGHLHGRCGICDNDE